MARPTADEELQLRKRARRRLIGAIVLVMVVVLVLPMVLDSEPKPVSQDIDIRIPSPEAGAFKSKIMPVVPAPETASGVKSQAGAAAQPEGGAKGAPAARDEAALKGGTGAQEKDSPKPPVAAQAPRPTIKTDPQKADAAAPESVTGSHVVQVVALRNAERAAEIHERIRSAGIKSYTEVVTTTKGDVTRVRAGPFPTSEAAERARDQILHIDFNGKKLDAKVIPVK